MAALSDNFWRSLADETGCSLPISLEDEFLLVERSLHKWDGLLEFIQGQTIKGSTDVSESADNQLLMRFPSQHLWDSSRVVLSQTADLSSPHFINASHVSLPQVHRNYILTESPLLHTISNFWRMVWELQIGSILMFNAFSATESGANQIHAYMPTGAENGDTDVIQFGDFVVSYVSRESCDTYNITQLLITENNTEQSRTVSHYTFSSWDSHTITPSRCDDLMGFIFNLYSRGFPSKPDQSASSPPTLVHCSDGLGRSGAFVLLEYCLQIIIQTQSLKGIKIPELVTELRGQRRGVITSGDQLKTVYTCLISGASKLLSPGSADCEEVRESDDESVDLETQQPQDPESSDEDFELISQPCYSSSDVGQDSEHMSSTESTGIPHDTIVPPTEPPTQSLTESELSNTDSIVPVSSEDTLPLVHTSVIPDELVEVLGEERVEATQEGTHGPPLSEKFHSIIPEPELTPEPRVSDVPVEVSEEGTHAPPLSEKFHSIIPELTPEPMTSGVTKRNPLQEGSKSPPSETSSRHNVPMVPQEHSTQSISIFVYLLLPLVVVVLVVLVLMWLN
eukprot:TRINITY_DN249_c0_g3_i3.p1 TRINITY_DN249_c0_g3~~TRINITY_DN249_c0_g3_i3.p1  ORF type:complete len:566 (+),score=162.44 TRINITY_DN249_c0_g3_i3:51-1748(+)